MKVNTASTGIGISTMWLKIDHKNVTEVATIDGLVSTIGFSLCGAGGRNGFAATVCTLST